MNIIIAIQRMNKLQCRTASCSCFYMSVVAQRWKSLTVPSFQLSRIGTIGSAIPINNQELLLFVESPVVNTVFKYNINNDTWSEWAKYPNDLKMNSHTSAINEIKTKIYIFNSDADIIEVNLKTKLYKIFKSNSFSAIYGAASLIIDDQFYIFGGWSLEEIQGAKPQNKF